MQWYYAEDGKSVGPFSDEDLGRLVAEGKVANDTLVWHAGLGEWQPFSQVGPRQAAAAAEPAGAVEGHGTCSECGRIFPRADMITYGTSLVCAQCKPGFFQKIAEGASVAGTLNYAGFWIRAGARLIDFVILFGFNLVMGLIVGVTSVASPSTSIAMNVVVQIIQFVIPVLYTVFFLGGSRSATPGKMVCKLKVIRADGSKITRARALGRHFAEWLSGLVLCAGYIMAAFDDEKRSLHDRICDTRVIKVD